MKEIDKEALKANKVLSIKDVEADLKEIEKFNWRNNMKYKLKDFVTDEMLVECGFEVSRYTHVSYAVREIKNEDYGLYIGLSKKHVLVLV